MTVNELVNMLYASNYIDLVDGKDITKDTKKKIENELRNSLVIKDGHHYVLVEVDK